MSFVSRAESILVGALHSGLSHMQVQERQGLIRRRTRWTFLTVDRGPAGGAHLWGLVCVCYC